MRTQIRKRMWASACHFFHKSQFLSVQTEKQRCSFQTKTGPATFPKVSGVMWLLQVNVAQVMCFKTTMYECGALTLPAHYFYTQFAVAAVTQTFPSPTLTEKFDPFLISLLCTTGQSPCKSSLFVFTTIVASILTVCEGSGAFEWATPIRIQCSVIAASVGKDTFVMYTNISVHDCWGQCPHPHKEVHVCVPGWSP